MTVLAYNVDVPADMLAAAIAGLRAGRYRRDLASPVQVGDRDVATLHTVGLLSLPSIVFLMPDLQPAFGCDLIATALAALSGTPVSDETVENVNVVLWACVPPENRTWDMSRAIAFAPTPWSMGCASEAGDFDGNPSGPCDMDPEILAILPTIVRISLTEHVVSEAIGLSGIVAFVATDTPPVDLLRSIAALKTLRNTATVEARPS